MPTLESIPTADVREPDLPMAIALQEAQDLRAALDADDTWDAVLAVGLDPALVVALPSAIAAARQAQSQWVVLRDRSKSRAQLDREQRGIALRRELSAACRWNLRELAEAQAVLDAIAQGEGIADLVQDLLDLATLVERHPPHFALDDTFDALAQAEAARSVASEIAEGLADDRADGNHRDAKRLRDRAFTHLDGIVTDIRAAGRYAFRDAPRRAAIFASRYLRRRRRAHRRRQAETIESTLTTPTTVAG